MIFNAFLIILTLPMVFGWQQSPTKILRKSSQLNAFYKTKKAIFPEYGAKGIRGIGIIIVGGPASGKEAQCDLISKEYDIVHLSMGALIRAEVAAKSNFGLEAKEFIESGRLVPDKLVIDFIAYKLRSFECRSRGWLLEGFPRTLPQAEALTNMGITVDSFINLDLSDEFVLDRFAGRLFDPVTGMVYHTTYEPPPPGEIASRVIQRPEDTVEGIRDLIQQFRSRDKIISKFYSNVKTVINAKKTKAEVFTDIKVVLDEARDCLDGVVEVETFPSIDNEMCAVGFDDKSQFSVKNEDDLKVFAQSIFDSLPLSTVKGGTLVLGGDGCFFNRDALQTLINVAAANDVKKIWVGHLTTPACSAVVRERKGRAFGAIVLTSTQTSGQFKLKFLETDGSPASWKLMDKIRSFSSTMKRYRIVQGASSASSVDVNMIRATYKVARCVVQVIDPIEDYVAVLKKSFDFIKLRKFLSRSDFSMIIDCSHGAGGLALRRIICKDLNAPISFLRNSELNKDLFGESDDKNVAFAPKMSKLMSLNSAQDSKTPDFGASIDGDASRNMIFGRGLFVEPSDSVAIILANSKCIPQFEIGVKCVGRSYQTSRALDVVASAMDVECFDAPSGFKFFSGIMDFGEGDFRIPFISGEENFKTSSSHLRENDGIWAVLAWLSVLAEFNKDHKAPLVSVGTILERHWERFGRHYSSQLDFPVLSRDSAEQVFKHLRSHIKSLAERAEKGGLYFGSLRCVCVEELNYLDPKDPFFMPSQGVIVTFQGGERAVFRLGEFENNMSAVRVNLERFDDRKENLKLPPIQVLENIREAALEASQIIQITGVHPQ